MPSQVERQHENECNVWVQNKEQTLGQIQCFGLEESTITPVHPVSESRGWYRERYGQRTDGNPCV